MNLRSLLIASFTLAAIAPISLSGQSPKAKAPFVEADKNGDGQLSEAEYLSMVKGKDEVAAAKKRFAELDKNRDKFVSREEFQAGVKALAGSAAAASPGGDKAPTDKAAKPKPKDDSR